MFMQYTGIMKRHRGSWVSLSPADRRAYASGSLVWNGTHFVPPSPGAMRYLRPATGDGPAPN